MNHRDTKTPEQLTIENTTSLPFCRRLAAGCREIAPLGQARNKCIHRKCAGLLTCWFILWAALSGNALSNGGQSTIKATVDQPTITIGDVLNLKVQVSHPDAVRIQFPSFADKLGVWTVRQAKQAASVRTQPGWSTDVYELQLTIYKTGEFDVPPIEVELLASSGKIEKTASSAIPIKVQSVLSRGDEALRELKPQAEISPDYKPFLLALAAILAALILIIQLVRHFRRHGHGEAVEPVDRRTPEEIPREAINRLLERRLIEQGLYKGFYLEISEIIKRYIGLRLGIIALERTTEEFMWDLKSTVLSAGQIEQLRNFLNDCDLVKFAKYHPSDQECREIVQIARGIVETTEQELLSLVPASEVWTR